MLEFLQNMDRRWVFLLMLLAVAIPILNELSFPEKATGMAFDTFNTIEAMEEGDKILLAFDYDPASEGELAPMATAFTLHACKKKLKIYFIALWPVGQQMIEDTIKRVIRADFPDMVYGEDYMNLGYKSGNEGVIKVIVTNFRELYTTDAYGSGIDSVPMMKNVRSVQDMDLVANVSAGYPGTKEWVQYASTAYPDDIRLVAGCTGVQAPLFYPYVPKQLIGLLGAIKGGAEYEMLVAEAYLGDDPDPKYLQGRRRMGPQLVAHLLMVGLIILGNVIFFFGRKKQEVAS
jgi:hypothetical protein